MNLLQNLSFKRKLILAFCAVLASVLLVFGLVSTGTAANAYTGEGESANTVELYADENGGGAIKPSHDYHTVTVSLRGGAKIYVDNTTAEQLKRNLIVEGTFQVGGTNYTVKLNPSEYALSCNGVTGDNVLFDAVPSGAVSVFVTANNHTASCEIQAADVTTDGIPQYTSIAVADLDNITGDYTAQTLIYANDFSVKGNGTEEITNYEFIEITMSGNSFTVTYTNPDGTKVATGGQITNVTSPEYITTVLQVNPAYTKRGEYWYDGDKSVFVYNMSRAEFLGGLELTVYYKNGERVLDLSRLTGASFTYSTGESVSIPNDFSFNSAAAEITFPLSISIGNKNYSVSVTVSLEARQVVTLSITGVGSDGVYNYDGSTVLKSGTASNTVLNSLMGKVTATYNSGNSGIINETSNAGLTISEPALTPTAQDIGSTTYYKTLTLVYTTTDSSGNEYSVSTQFKVQVEYELPSMIWPAISGNMASQTYRRPIDYSGLTVQLMYPDNSVSVPLADFVSSNTDYVITTFYDASGNELGTNTFTQAVNSVKIVFKYNTSMSSDPVSFNKTYTVGANFEIAQLPVALPDIGAFEVNYSNDLVKDIIFSDDLNGIIPTISVFSVVDDAVSDVGDNAVISGNSVSFKVAGKYQLHFTLSEDDFKEVRWNSSNINKDYVDIQDNVLIYKITINPSEVKVRVVLDQTQTTYGTAIGYKIEFAAMGTNDWFELTDELKTKTQTVVTVTYKGVGNGYNGSAYPKNAGEYLVNVDIASAAYDPKTYLEDPKFKINPAELDPDTVQSFSYDRTDRHVSDFINASSLGVKYSESLSAIMSAKGSDGNAVDLSTKTFKNVSDTDTLTLTLTSNNYYWKNSSNDKTKKVQDVKLEITALNLGITVTDGAYLDFVYGTTAALPAVTKALTAKDSGNNETGRFYATEVTEYYLATDFSGGAPISGATPLNASDYSSWDYKGADGYVIYIKTSLDSASGDKTGDYNLPSAYAYFTVSRAQITKVGFTDDGNSTTYSASDITLTLDNWQNGKMTGAVTSTVTTASTNVSQTDGKITVKHAGTYTVTVTLDNNYDWDVAEGTNYHYTVSFTYTVDQKEIEFTIDNLSFDYDGNTHRPQATLSGISANELDISATKLYDEYKNELSADPSAIGDYYIAVTAWTAKAGADANAVNDYKLSYKAFSIITSAMSKPSLIANGGILGGGNTSVTVTYKGSEYYFKDYIYGYTSDYVYGTNSKIVITVTAVTGDRRDMTDVNTYNVAITPATNFKWDTAGNDNDTSAVNFTFIIEQKQLTGLTWSNTTFTYDGKNHTPTATPDGLCAGDTNYVAVTVSGEKKNAGTGYSATATGLTQGSAGDRSFNYSLPSSGMSTTFDIDKRSINAPTYTATTLTYGTDNSLKFTLDEGFTDVTDWSWSDVVSCTVSGEYNFDGVTQSFGAEGTGFDFSNGNFSFVNAGTYTITFNIKTAHADNYQWSGSNTSTVTVNRKIITAPRLVNPDDSTKSGRTLERTGSDRKPSYAWGTGYPDPGNIYTVSYGGFTKGTNDSYAAASDFKNVGEYYICFTISGDGLLNYVWAENASDTEARGFVTQYCKAEYTAAAVRIYLNYAVTQKILEISYTVNGYTYGDNGGAGGKGIDDVLVLGGKDYSLLTGEGTYASVGITQTITFIDSKGNTAGTVIIKREAGDADFSAPYTETAYPLLENFIPWNAGTYTVKTKIEFSGNQLNELSADYTLTVSKKVIDADWFESDGTTEAQTAAQAEYNGSVQKLVAVINNAPARADGSKDALPALEVGSVSGNLKDAKAYTLKVTAINYADGAYENYTLPNTDITHAFTITPHTVNVTSASVSNHVYATAYANLNGLWTVDDSSQFYDGGNGADYVKVKVTDGSDTVDVSKADVGDYTVELYLEGAGSENYVLDVTEGTFTIVAREIKVSITDDKDNLKGVYGGAKNLYDPAVYKVEWINSNGSTDSAIPEWIAVTRVFEVRSGASKEGANAGEYDITVTVKNNDNFSVTVDGTDNVIGTYEILKADITVGSISGTSRTYDGKEHALIGDAVTVSEVVSQGGMTAVYKYSKDGGTTWKDASGVTVKDVADSGTYIIKLTADNHNDLILDGVEVTISKATLTVELNLEIFYSEESPVSKSFLMSASNLSDSRYTIDGYKGGETIDDIGASGTLSYTTDYKKNDLAGDYSLNLDVSGLSSANYDFTEGTSKLTVTPLNITVAVDDMQEVYWYLIDRASPVYGKITLATNDKSTYDSSKNIDITGISAKDILGYETDAITVDGNGIVTDMADADTYTVTFKSNGIAGKYILNGVNINGEEVATADFKITNADLILNSDVSGYNGNYDEAYHTLTVGGDGEFAKTYNPDKNVLTVKYYVSESVTSAINWNGADIKTELPEFVNVGTYYLYYNLSADNHNSHTAYVVIVINFVSENTVTGHFAFEGKDTVFADAESVDKDAWIYGLAGYNSKGNIVEPTATFDGVAGGSGTAKQFVFTLYYNDNILEIEGTFNTAQDLFGAVLNAGLFNAGDYRIHYEMDGGDNFGKAEGDRYFRVGKNSLTITANSIEVTYGEEVASDKYTQALGYGYTAAGLVNNGQDDDTVSDVFAGGVLPKFVSSYIKGSFVGTYDIDIDDGEYASANYDVTFVKGTLTVVKREITIVIESKSSSFHYYNDDGVQAKALTYKFYGVNGTKFYADDINGNNQLDTKVFTLYTNATLAQNGFDTQNAGTYPVFAMFNKIDGDAENRTYAHNYIINIVEEGENALYDKAVTSEIIGAVDPDLSEDDLIENAGVYTITPAKLALVPDENPSWATSPTGELKAYADPGRSKLYDGYYKGFTASVVDDGVVNMTGVKFYAVYGTERDISKMSSAMFKDVGTYYYRYVTDNPNYEWNSNDYYTLTISSQTITVTRKLDGKDGEFLPTQTYKNGEYVIEFTFNGLQQDEIIELDATVTPSVCSGSDTYFNGYINSIYGTFAKTNDKDSNTYTLKVKNAGVYEISFVLADTEAMKNYAFSYGYTFTVTRADFTVRANSSVVQYGTAISKAGTPQPMAGVTAPSVTGVSAENWNTVADYYRFYGFSLMQNVLDKAKEEGKIDGTSIDYFNIAGVTYGFNGTDYNAATTQAVTGGQQTVLNIEPDANTIHAFNYNIVTTVTSNTEYGKLYVAQRRINVTLNGYESNDPTGTSFASTIYSGGQQQPDYVGDHTADFFEPEAYWYGVTADSNNFLGCTATKLTVSDAVNAGDYKMHAFQDDHTVGTTVTNNTNYKVTFINDNEALFHIAKKDIKIQVVSTKDGSTSFDIIYGDKTEGYYKVIYYGIVPVDGGYSTGSYQNDTKPVDGYDLAFGSVTGGIKYEERATGAIGSYYIPWESHAKSMFSINISGSDISFTNYNVVLKNSADMTVVSRKVTATTSDRVYTEDTDLHGGAYGIEHNAIIKFTDVKDASISYTDSAYAPNNYLSYLYTGTENGGSAYNGSTAPKKAGAYTVQITFNANVNYGDYVFDVDNQSGTGVSSTSVTFKYNVNKKAISLDWDPASLENLTFNEGDEKYVLINSPYVEALTVVNYVQLIKNDSSVENIERNEDGYTINGEGFSVKIYSVGTYSVLIVFNSDAVHNYKWDAEDTMKSLSLAFSVNANSFRITDLEMESWTYNDVDENGDLVEHKPTYNLTNGVTVPITFTYATVTGDLPENVYVNSEINGATYRDISKSSASTNIPVNAGVYILVASYIDVGLGYSSTSAYYIFEIYQREVQAPVFVQAGETYVYNGEVQTADIKYSHREITGAYTGTSSLGADGITLSATDAKTYKIVFSLNDARNCKWAQGVTDGTTYTVEWEIIPAEDNEIIWDGEICVTYGTDITLSATSTYGGSLTEYYFALRNPAHTAVPADTVWTLWTEENHPVNSGCYWVKAVDRGNSNYNECEASEKITIDKAWLTVTAYGSAVYGDGEEDRRFGYEFSGFIKGTEEVTVSGIEYVLEHADKYVAGVYDVQLKCTKDKIDGKDVVEGMSAQNYYVTPAVGEFTVTRRSIMVILGSARSVYGDYIDLSQIEIRVVTENGLAQGDTLSDLEISLELDADRNVDILSKFNNVGAYTVNAVGYEDNANYNITVFGSGTYTIAPLSIFITAEPGGGTYDSGDIQGAKITGIYAIAGGEYIDVIEVFGNKAPTFRFNYWGISNDGKWNKTNGDNCNTEPDRAGIYHATAVASNSENFTLLTNYGTPSVTFTVEKKVIDESVISVEKQAYANTALTPVITDEVYSGIYTVGSVSETEVGTYNVPVTLTDPYNYKWTSVEGAVYNLSFEIVRGENVIGKPEIKGWTYLGYSAENNTPTAEVKFGSAEDFVFTYSSSEDGEYSANVPVNAGKYWVKITVPQTDNYFAVTSEPAEFEITKAKLNAPALVIVAEGEGQNVVYTGSRLQAMLDGYDSRTMHVIYDGDMSVGNAVSVFALNAGTYFVKIVLNDDDNYTWAESVSLDEDGNAGLKWTVARKKLAKPSMTSDMYMVNGKMLTFIPEGFDEATMNISGNQTSYGGVFDVVVSLKDTTNYEWADSSVESVTLAWVVVGWDTVFVIVVSVLGAVAGIAAIVIAVQYVLHLRKKRRETELESAETASREINAAEQPAETAVPEKTEPEVVQSENTAETAYEETDVSGEDEIPTVSKLLEDYEEPDSGQPENDETVNDTEEENGGDGNE